MGIPSWIYLVVFWGGLIILGWSIWRSVKKKHEGRKIILSANAQKIKTQVNVWMIAALTFFILAIIFGGSQIFMYGVFTCFIVASVKYRQLSKLSNQ